MLKKPCSYGLILHVNSEIPFLSLKGAAFSMHDAPIKALHRTAMLLRSPRDSEKVNPSRCSRSRPD